MSAETRPPVPVCQPCGQPIRPRPLRCECGHSETSHDIATNGARTACFRLNGPRGDRCPCKRFTLAAAN